MILITLYTIALFDATRLCRNDKKYQNWTNGLGLNALLGIVSSAPSQQTPITLH